MQVAEAETPEGLNRFFGDGPPLISRTPNNEDNPRMEVFDGKAPTILSRVQA